MTSSSLTSWQRLRSRTAFSNQWLSVELDDVRLPNGQVYEYTLIRRLADGVAVFAFDDQQRLLLEQEYRYPVDQVIWQLPGGLVDAHEDPLTAIQRELAEETGYEAEVWEYLGAFWANPALGEAKIHLYLAQKLRPTGRVELDPAEFITTAWRSWEWVKEAVRKGEIRERVILAGMGMLMARGLC